MTQHSVVLVPFPFDDLSTTKVRPAVCLTHPIGMHNHVVLAFITSRVASTPLATDLIIDANGKHFAQTGLRVTSTLRLHRLMTVSTAIIKRKLGELSPDMATAVQACLITLFGIENLSGTEEEDDENLSQVGIAPEEDEESPPTDGTTD